MCYSLSVCLIPSQQNLDCTSWRENFHQYPVSIINNYLLGNSKNIVRKYIVLFLSFYIVPIGILSGANLFVWYGSVFDKSFPAFLKVFIWLYKMKNVFWFFLIFFINFYSPGWRSKLRSFQDKKLLNPGFHSQFCRKKINDNWSNN